MIHDLSRFLRPLLLWIASLNRAAGFPLPLLLVYFFRQVPRAFMPGPDVLQDTRLFQSSGSTGSSHFPPARLPPPPDTSTTMSTTMSTTGHRRRTTNDTRGAAILLPAALCAGRRRLCVSKNFYYYDYYQKELDSFRIKLLLHSNEAKNKTFIKPKGKIRIHQD